MSLRIIFFSFILFVSLHVKGQNGYISLKKALIQLEDSHGINFSYADDLVERLKVKPIPGDSLNFQLAQFSAETGLLFDQVRQSTYLVTTPTHRFCLRVVNEHTRQAMSGAHILMNDNSHSIITDKMGFARFEGKFTLQDTIHIKYFGFEPKKITSGDIFKNDCPEVGLVFGETLLEEVVITSYLTSGIDFSMEDHSISVKTDDLSLLPGETDGDILLAIKTLPGITSPSGKAGNLHIRGSTTDQTLVLFDNIPVYHKGHYFGAISPYNPAIVNEVKVYRSGFGPNLGGRVGGAIKLESKKSIPDSTLYGISLSSYFGSALMSVPIGDKFSINASFRTSFLGEWEPPKLKALKELVFQPSTEKTSEDDPNQEFIGDEFRFRDFNANLNYKIKNGHLALSFLHIHNDRIDETLNTLRNTKWKGKLDLDNHGTNFEWLQYWNSNFSSTLSLTSSDYRYNSSTNITAVGGSRPTINPNYFENNIKDYAVHADGNYVLNPLSSASLSFGYQMNYHSIDNISISNKPGQPEKAFKEEKSSYLHSLFLNHQLRATKALSVNIGLRGNHYTLTKEYRLEPRFFLNLDVNNHFSLKSSAGRYSQYISQYVYFDFEDTKVENMGWHLADEEKPVVKSNQWMVGGIWNPETLIVDVEFYYKNISNLSTRRSGNDFVNGNLKIAGMDFLLRKTWKKLDTWVSYTYSLTAMNFPDLNKVTFETYYDQPHAFNINATMPWSNWQFSLGWQYLSGVPIYTNNTFFPVPGEGGTPPASDQSDVVEKSEGRFPDQHQLDLALVHQYQPKSKGWKASIGVSILNVYDRKNFIAENYLTFGPNTSLVKRYSIGFAPNVVLNVKW